MDAAKTFLDFQTLSIVPLRTWSMIHTVLSSTLLLCVWEETRSDPECRDLQQRVIEMFSAVQPSRQGNASPPSVGSQWLSERQIRALVTLRNAVRNAPMGTRTIHQDKTDQHHPDQQAFAGASEVSFDSASNLPYNYQ